MCTSSPYCCAYTHLNSFAQFTLRYAKHPSMSDIELKKPWLDTEYMARLLYRHGLNFKSI